MVLASDVSGRRVLQPVATPLKKQTLAVAASLVGGAEELAKVLGVPENTVGAWLEGKEDPPGEMFLRALDVILDELEERDLPSKT